ncbi:hypothetical protein LCGC14_2078240, partial [marine sediment metagenome]
MCGPVGGYTFLGLGLLIVISLPPRPLTVRIPTFGGPTCRSGGLKRLRREERAFFVTVFRVRTPMNLRAFLTTFFPTFLTALATFLWTTIIVTLSS